MPMTYQWRTIRFTPDTSWEAVYQNEDGTMMKAPIAGWLLQEQLRVNEFGNYIKTEGPKETRVIAADPDGAELEPCNGVTNFQGLQLREQSTDAHEGGNDAGIHQGPTAGRRDAGLEAREG